jgi:hypothetical protein
MKKNVLLVFFLAVSMSLFSQKVTITWVKNMTTTDTNLIIPVIRHAIWFPQVLGSPADKKINQWLKSNAAMWSDYNYVDTIDGAPYSAFSRIAIINNGNGFLKLYRKYGWESQNRGRENGYYLTINLKTGTTQQKAENYDSVNLDN